MLEKYSPVSILSTGRSGSKLIVNLLDLSKDINAFHEPRPAMAQKDKVLDIVSGRQENGSIGSIVSGKGKESYHAARAKLKLPINQILWSGSKEKKSIQYD